MTKEISDNPPAPPRPTIEQMLARQRRLGYVSVPKSLPRKPATELPRYYPTLPKK